MLIGYARVSTPSQNLDRQLAALEAAGCQRIFREKASGRSTRGRPQLTAAMRALTKGDTLVLAEWDRATRSMFDGVQIIAQVAEKGAMIKALDKPWADLTTPIGQGILGLLSSMAQDERERIARRAEEGRVEARKRGVKFGRPPAISSDRRPHIVAMIEDRVSDTDIARVVGVHPTTIGRLRKAFRSQERG